GEGRALKACRDREWPREETPSSARPAWISRGTVRPYRRPSGLGMKMDEHHTNSLSCLYGLGCRKDPREYFDRRALMFEGGALQSFCAVGKKSQTKFPLSP